MSSEQSDAVKRAAYGQLGALQLSLELAWQNLHAHRVKSLLIGGVLCSGALATVLGACFAGAITDATARSITESLTGHLQVYSAASKGELDVVGGLDTKLAPIGDYAALRSMLLAQPNVSAVVPMAIDLGVMSTPNHVERALSALRTSATTQNVDTTDGAPDKISHSNTNKYLSQKRYVRQLVDDLRRFTQTADWLDIASRRERAETLKHAASEAFWSDFDADPLAHLEWLDNHIARLAGERQPTVLRYVGTDPSAFAEAFQHMELVDGSAIPPGQRGILMSKLMYEDQLKLKSARGFDKLKASLDRHHGSIARDAALQRLVRDNIKAASELQLQLDPDKRERVRNKLQQFLGVTEPDSIKLLRAFFATDDDNFHARHAFFYRELAPELELYAVRIGEPLTLRAMGRHGYTRSATLPLYGTFQFKGLEGSPLAGAINMLDLVTFRELHGLADAGDTQREVEQLRAAAGANHMPRDRAEQDLFAVKQGPDSYVGTRAELSTDGPVRSKPRSASSTYDPKDLRVGSVLNVAVFLRDPTQLAATANAIERAGQHSGQALKVAPWQSAAGSLWSLAQLIQVVLAAAAFILFVVGVLVVSNAIVMATLERVREIGTLRAIGAHKRFVLGSLLVEATLYGVAFGGLGAALGGMIITSLRRTGVPASDDALLFLFGGPRLYPELGLNELLFGVLAALTVSIASSLYPGYLALRVGPLEAMAVEE